MKISAINKTGCVSPELTSLISIFTSEVLDV